MIAEILYTDTGQILKTIVDTDVGNAALKTRIQYQILPFDAKENPVVLRELRTGVPGYSVDPAGPTLKKNGVEVPLEEDEYARPVREQYQEIMDDLDLILAFDLDLDLGTISDLPSARAAIIKLQAAVGHLETGTKKLANQAKLKLALIKNRPSMVQLFTARPDTIKK